MSPKYLSIPLAIALATGAASSQTTIVDNSRPAASIILHEDNPTNRTAADILNRFISEISGTTLPIVPDGKAPKKGNAIIIGQPTDDAGEDGFVIDGTDGHTVGIATGGGRGAIYGVTDLLENQLGVKYYAKDYYTLSKSPTIIIPRIHKADTPAFRYRQSQSYALEDSIGRHWMRMKEPRDIFTGGLWVHTFDRILPSTKYGNDHPEYYSFINGERRPGNHSQWCLTNPEVFEVVCTRLDSIFAANPGTSMISISQNDGNFTQCACPRCKAVDEAEGSLSGNYVRFLNKLAQRYPDKEFSTLAYLFTMHPPKLTKPLPNVNIMLCDIDCKREVALPYNESGREFVKALEGWGKISNNIFVWDYGINFDGMVSPFPNFHILADNLRLFKKNGATMVFEQVNGVRGADFAEMRAYMLAKLMWNPDLDADSLMRDFAIGYYGEAAPLMIEYRKMLEGALLSSDTPLWIYDSPISHKNGMLNANLRRRYNELFDKAEKAVASDSAHLAHVRMGRLPLMFSELEIARTEPSATIDRDALAAKVEEFRRECAIQGVTTLNERNNSPSDYCDLYLTRFLPGGTTNKAAGATVTWIKEPAKSYQPIADKALTDGLFGGTTYVESWVGWEGSDAEFILDLGKPVEINAIEADFLHQLGAWVLAPKGGRYQVSLDGTAFTSFGEFAFDEDRDVQVKFKKGRAESTSPVTARYIKVAIDGIGMCPDWHYGVGHPAWFFLDEITVE